MNKKPKFPEPGMVVQVSNQDHPQLGVLFIVGDIRAGEVHGFYMRVDGSREYATVKFGDVKVVGKALINSRSPCSPEWNQHETSEKSQGEVLFPKVPNPLLEATAKAEDINL